MAKNITIELEEQLAEKAAAMASASQRPLPEWVADLVDQAVNDPRDFDRARRQALARLERGLALGGRPLAREEIYGRGAGLP